MQIQCLGSTGYHPSDSRQTACYLLAQDGVVLDAGTGIYRLPPLIQTDSIDILISHAHLDHIAGLTFLLDILFQRPVPAVRVWGEAEKLEAIRTHLFNPLIFPAPLPVTWHPIDHHKTFLIGAPPKAGSPQPVTVDWRGQEHPSGSVGYRLKWQSPAKTLVYATDTTGDESESMSQWIDGADLLMHECYFCDHQQEWAIMTGHCWTSRAAGIAKAGRVKKLLMTHISPLATGHDPIEIDKARKIFPQTFVATDYAVTEF